MKKSLITLFFVIIFSSLVFAALDDIIPEICCICLDDITNALPIYDKLADVNKQEEELDVIRKKFNIAEGEDAGRLWKVLLKRKSEDKGKESLYTEIQELLGKKNLKMVSFQHFENHWINPESKSLAPIVKKVFL